MENNQGKEVKSANLPENKPERTTGISSPSKKLTESDKEALLKKEQERLKDKLKEMDDEEADDFYDTRGL